VFEINVIDSVILIDYAAFPDPACTLNNNAYNFEYLQGRYELLLKSEPVLLGRI
jgi:hypothetical protein